MLQSTKPGNLEPDIWFLFQKSKYVYDWDKKTFHTISFPTNKTFGEYVDSKGFIDDEHVSVAEKDYGKNEMVMVRYFCFIIIYFYTNTNNNIFFRFLQNIKKNKKNIVYCSGIPTILSVAFYH